MNELLLITYCVGFGLFGNVIWNAVIASITNCKGISTPGQAITATIVGALIGYTIYAHLPMGVCQ